MRKRPPVDSKSTVSIEPPEFIIGSDNQCKFFAPYKPGILVIFTLAKRDAAPPFRRLFPPVEGALFVPQLSMLCCQVGKTGIVATLFSIVIGQQTMGRLVLWIQF